MTPGLSDRAVIEIDTNDDSGETRTCVFELQEDLEIAPNTTKSYLIGNRGQYLREAVDVGADIFGVDLPESDNRRGYYIDGGAGVEAISITATGGDRDKQWGDGSSDPDDPDDVTMYDATGCDPREQIDVLDYLVSQAKTDSASPARLFYGQWSDGTHADTAGVFGKPRAVAIQETNIEDPTDDPSGFSVTIETVWAAVLPEASVDEAQDALDELTEISPE